MLKQKSFQTQRTCRNKQHIWISQWINFSCGVSKSLLILLKKAPEDSSETKRQVSENTEGHGRLPV